MIEIIVVEDDEILRNSLAVLIDDTDGFSCVNTYQDCESAIENLEADLPDVILMDIELPGMSGIEGTAKIKQKLPEVEIIMLTIHEDNESVFESLRNGASGYLVK
ncbi:response regulator transcription factor, partial [candidate division KSB1 bacterium]|nr:response regulator transcription factor [candidate division KSB1 bacterium]NIR71867.1 response regulator transcription factor [candidate division KSB1 bacterium]NIS26434.1 response regulator transcription factor [candidate division KSB1 bacterium]NIT73204.1 response regulator transcription factor [candidate division KSB1 bacterium]NIU27118.1 response regulator transcription factor [candidate division KSB1 bacterium]